MHVNAIATTLRDEISAVTNYDGAMVEMMEYKLTLRCPGIFLHLLMSNGGGIKLPPPVS